jgi:hypothetical protein
MGGRGRGMKFCLQMPSYTAGKRDSSLCQSRERPVSQESSQGCGWSESKSTNRMEILLEQLDTNIRQVDKEARLGTDRL